LNSYKHHKGDGRHWLTQDGYDVFQVVPPSFVTKNEMMPQELRRQRRALIGSSVVSALGAAAAAAPASEQQSNADDIVTTTKSKMLATSYAAVSRLF
jgi:hypothetical protein